MKKRILYVHHSGAFGGAPKSLKFLIEKIDASEYEPIILVINEGPGTQLLRSTGKKLIVNTKIKPFHGSTVSGMNAKLFIKNIVGILPTYREAKKIISDLKPDIIHLNSTCLFVVAAAAKSVNKKIKIISHVREPLLFNFPGKILKYFNNKFADAFVAISNFDAETIKINNEKLFKVIYNFVDFNSYNPTIQSDIIRRELDLPNNSFIILYLARIVPQNGALEMLKMVSKIHTENKDIHFVIVGFDKDNPSNYATEVKELCQRNRNFHIMGYRDDVPQLLASSNLLVSPFIVPHFARGIIEANAIGIPAIGTDIGGVNELIVDQITGYLYNTPEEFNSIISNLYYNHDLYKKIAKQAVFHARKNFDANKNAEETISLYREL